MPGGPGRTVPERVIELAQPIADLATVELPTPSDGVRVWAEGDGVAAVAVHDVSRDLLDSATPACRAVAENLDAEAGPPEVNDAIARAPDVDTRNIFASEYSSIGRALAACDSDEFSRLQAELAYQWGITQRHLADAGVDP